MSGQRNTFLVDSQYLNAKETAPHMTLTAEVFDGLEGVSVGGFTDDYFERQGIQAPLPWKHNWDQCEDGVILHMFKQRHDFHIWKTDGWFVIISTAEQSTRSTYSYFLNCKGHVCRTVILKVLKPLPYHIQPLFLDQVVLFYVFPTLKDLDTCMCMFRRH